MKKLLIICPYPEGVAPSQRLKYEQYFDAFRENGWEIRVEPFISDSFWKVIYKKGKVFSKAWYTISGYVRRLKLLGRIRKYDVVYLHLWASPFGPPLMEKWIRRRAKKLIYDIDDLIYLKNTSSKNNSMIGFLKGRQKPLYLMKHADHVVTCTPYLDEFVRRFNSNTTDISSTVDTIHRYQPVNNYQNDHPIVIGWSGSHSTSKYFLLLAGVFKKLALTKNFRLLVMGDASLKIDGLEVKAIPWKEEHEIETLQRFDIGVYPLPDEEWVYGKSGLKAIQYMALGIPTVATAIGTNFRVIENGVSGFLVGPEEEWLIALSNLIENAELRRVIGMNARKKVEQEFSVAANKNTYLQIINSI